MSRGAVRRVPRAWQRMLSGRRLDLLDPSPFDVELDDVAHGLARVARWNGQTTGEHVLSVAQHSLLVEAIAGELVPELAPPDRRAALLHDAAEYVIGDMISPLKAMIGDGYAEVESRLRAAIHLRFGLPAEPGRGLSRLIKRADRIAAHREAVRLAGFSSAEADAIFGRPDDVTCAEAFLTAWPAREAEERFRRRFATLAEG